MITRRWAAALAWACVSTAWAQADEEPRTWFQLHATDAHWRLSADSGSLYARSPGTLVSTEDELGLPRRKKIPGIGFGRLIGQRWRIEVDHTSARRKGSTVLANDLKRGEYTFVAGSTLQADVGLSTLRVNGGFTVWQTESMQATLLIGGQWLKISQRLEGTATVDDYPPGSPNPMPGPAGPQSVSTSDLTPVGLLGLQAQWQPAPGWRLRGRGEVGSEKYLHLSADAQWWPVRHLALGAGYRVMRAELDSTFCFIACTRFVSNFRIHGPTLNATLAF